MRFRVGPWLYRVRISDKALTDNAGQRADGLCCWSDRTIWISGTLPTEQRLDTLLHELGHAWQEHFGTPASPEGVANQNSSFTADVWNQLQRQGGVWALSRLRSDGVIDPGAADAPNTAYAISCGECGSMVAIGSVLNSPAKFNPDFGVVTVERSVECEFCSHTMTWVEGTTAMGKPSGKVLEGPRISRAVAH